MLQSQRSVFNQKWSLQVFISLGIKSVFKVQLCFWLIPKLLRWEGAFQNQSSNHTVSGYGQEIDLVMKNHSCGICNLPVWSLSAGWSLCPKSIRDASKFLSSWGEANKPSFFWYTTMSLFCFSCALAFWMFLFWGVHFTQCKISVNIFSFFRENSFFLQVW